MRTLGFITTSRADYSLLRPLLRAAGRDAEFQAWLYVTGSHLLTSQGHTIDDIHGDGQAVHAEIPAMKDGDQPAQVARNMASTTSAFADVFEKERPDILVLLGDRFEMHAAALAAVPFNIPLAHIHGGEATEGLIDEAIRHSLTKFSHLHFASHPDYAARILQLGEEDWRVRVCGAPGLENISRDDLMDDTQLEKLCGIAPGESPLVVTFHPLTLDIGSVETQCREFFKALESVEVPIVITRPNMDTHGSLAAAAAERFAAESPNRHLVDNLGSRGYFALLARATAMAGNSSSGIIEAASFGLPVVNVGERQAGRIHGSNVLDCACESAQIGKALQKALDTGFRDQCQGMKNPYDRGGASSIILETLKSTTLDRKLLVKRFQDRRP